MHSVASLELAAKGVSTFQLGPKYIWTSCTKVCHIKYKETISWIRKI
jgi:hypothetical protein